MMSRIGRTLWVRVVLYAVLGVLAAGAASLAGYLPMGLPLDISVDAIDSLLSVLSSSMLAVTTFSIGSLMTAYGSATSNGTPRATTLLAEDAVVQSALATFVGSFLFSIVGMVALRISAYGPEGRALLFLVTLAVIGLVVQALLRWIDQLTRLGRVGDTLERIEEATHEAMTVWLDHPSMDGRPRSDAPPPPGQPVPAGRVGYIQHVDVAALDGIARKQGVEIDLLVLPGSFVYEDTPLAQLRGPDAPAALPQELVDEIRAEIALDAERTYDQDPRFGLVTMSEVALRALSPAVNDPGTAIDVIGRQTRLLSFWARGWDKARAATPEYPRVTVAPLSFADLYDDAFNQIGRDGAGQVDVMLRLMKALIALTRTGPYEARQAAHRQLRLAYARAMHALVIEDDKARLNALYAGGVPA